MAITITSESIQFQSGSGEQTTFVQSEIKNLKSGKAISGSGEFRGDRIMGNTDSTTFIDFGGARKKLHYKQGSNVGSITFASRGRDVFHIHKNIFDFGDNTLPAIVSINNADSIFNFEGKRATFGNTAETTKVHITGSLTVSGSNTFTNFGNFTNYMINTPNQTWGNHKFVIESKTLNDAFSSISQVSRTPYVQFIATSSGHVGVGTQQPKHTLHVTSSDSSWNALHVEGPVQFNGFGAGMGFGNAQTISVNTIVPANYNGVLWVTNYNDSITVSQGVDMTINQGADIRIANSSLIGNIPQTFYDG